MTGEGLRGPGGWTLHSFWELEIALSAYKKGKHANPKIETAEKHLQEHVN